MQAQTNPHSRGGRAFGRRRSFSHASRSQNRFSSKTNRGFSRGKNNRNYGRGARKLPIFDPSQFINTNPVEETVEIYKPKHQFSTFGLSPKLVRTIASLGMKQPTPIQDQIIPNILEGKDVVGLAETGTGKTAAFLLPLIEKALQTPTRQTLILTPTRELAIQVENEFKNISRGSRLYSVICVGGTNIRQQMYALRKKNQFVIGTPGRILDLINRGSFKAGYVQTIVLDEADRMLDMGFIGDIRKILSNVPKERETLLFSATMTADTRKIINEFLKNPIVVSVKKKDIRNNIEQNVVPYKEEDKFQTLTALLKGPEFSRVIIFGTMKHTVEKLAKQLSVHGIKAESLHGNKNQHQRQRSLDAFKRGHARVLVATDIAARGIHVDNISHVINYDLPHTFEDYVHRIGRTGRVDKHGKALTFVPASHSH